MPMAVPIICKKSSLLNSKMLSFKVSSRSLTRNSLGNGSLYNLEIIFAKLKLQLAKAELGP